MKMISKFFLVLMLSILWTMTAYAAPLLETKDAWDIFEPVIKTTCSSDGQCWGWLPISEVHDDTTIVTPDENSDTLKLQSRRQISNPISDFALKSWKDGITLEETKQGIQSLPTNKQIPTKITKKDVFISRNWGAGGMPFSVLYMNQHGSRSNHVAATSAANQRQESATTKSPTSHVEHPNYQRNRQPTVQPRRQYLSIPQLFISYGWGPFGK